MKLSNGFIHSCAPALYNLLQSDISFPALANYKITKNINQLVNIYQELEKERIRVCEKYSTGLENDNYKFEDSEKRTQAEQELNALMLDEQEVNILKFPIESLGNTNLTTKQMNLLMFMIDEGEEV